jgi:hypothetical protein
MRNVPEIATKYACNISTIPSIPSLTRLEHGQEEREVNQKGKTDKRITDSKAHNIHAANRLYRLY